MYGTGKDTTKDYPEIGGRTEQNTQDSSEDGTRSCNVQKLNEEYTRRGYGQIVHPVTLGVTWHGTMLLRTKDMVYNSSIDKISQE